MRDASALRVVPVAPPHLRDRPARLRPLRALRARVCARRSSRLRSAELLRKMRGRFASADVVALGRGAEAATRVATAEQGLIRSLAILEPAGLLTPRDRGLQRLAARLALSLGDRAARALFSLMATRPWIRHSLRERFRGAPDPELLEYAHASAKVPGAHHAPLAALALRRYQPETTQLYHSLTIPVLVVHDARGAHAIELEAFSARPREPIRDARLANPRDAAVRAAMRHRLGLGTVLAVSLRCGLGSGDALSWRASCRTSLSACVTWRGMPHTSGARMSPSCSCPTSSSSPWVPCAGVAALSTGSRERSSEAGEPSPRLLRDTQSGRARPAPPRPGRRRVVALRDRVGRWAQEGEPKGSMTANQPRRTRPDGAAARRERTRDERSG